MPVLPNYVVSHQWLRELRRWRPAVITGIYFRIGDDEEVSVGHYRQVHRRMTASEAAGTVMHAEQPEGFEVIVLRRVEAGEIYRVKRLPQVTGWRYHPGANGTRPCPCDFCQRGLYGAARVRRRLGD
ncbi:MAG: hypothetical protein ACYTGX_15250 [Planctomycetota bacterium]